MESSLVAFINDPVLIPLNVKSYSVNVQKRVVQSNSPSLDRVTP